MKEVEGLLNSKYIDLTIAVFMAIFSYINFTNGRMGMTILFAVLMIANLFTAYLKHNRMKENEK